MMSLQPLDLAPRFVGRMLPVITHVCTDEKTALTILVHVLYEFFLVMSVAR